MPIRQRLYSTVRTFPWTAWLAHEEPLMMPIIIKQIQTTQRRSCRETETVWPAETCKYTLTHGTMRDTDGRGPFRFCDVYNAISAGPNDGVWRLNECVVKDWNTEKENNISINKWMDKCLLTNDKMVLNLSPLRSQVDKRNWGIVLPKMIILSSNNVVPNPYPFTYLMETVMFYISANCQKCALL